MYLEKLNVLSFKNFKEAELSFKDGINCLVGNNGVGKTNLLDAIYYLSFCKSYFNAMDSQNIKDEDDFFVIKGKYNKEDKAQHLFCSLKRGDKKIFKANDNTYNKLADHIGLFPLVIISPSDTDYIHEGSDVRRKYIDSVMAQFDKLYLDDLLNYNKALTQRNHLLKLFFEKNAFDASALEIWDEKLIVLGQKIYDKRLAFIQKFIPVFQDIYTTLSGGKEKVGIEYVSHLHAYSYRKLLKESLNADRKALYSTVGIHKDDLVFTISNKALKKFGSQGQQKTFLIALKLAQFVITKNIKKMTPLLLLDDIFDKLDHLRVSQLIAYVSKEGFQQVFITDTDHNRLLLVLKEVNLEAAVFMVKNNSVEQINL